MGFIKRKFTAKANDYRGYHIHIGKVALGLQKVLTRFGITVRPTENSRPDIPSVILAALNESKNVEGMIHPPQIKAFGEILRHLLRRGQEGWEYVPQHIAVSALTMSGKTGLINLCGLLPPIINLLTGAASATESVVSDQQRLFTNHCDLEKQANDAATNFAALYKNLEFHCEDGEYTSLWDYRDGLRTLTKSGADAPLVGQGYRTSPSNTPHFRRQNKLASTHNISLIKFADEADGRSDSDSVMAKWMQGIDDNEFEGESLEDISFLGLSATNDAFHLYCKRNGLPCVEMLPAGVQYANDPSPAEFPPIFTGLPWINKKKLKNMLILKVLSFSALDAELATLGDPKFILDYNTWRKQKKNRNSGPNQWNELRRRWIIAFCKVVKRLLIGWNPARGKGLMARIVVKNSLMKGLAEILKHYLPEVKVILHNQEEALTYDGSKITLKEHIDKECGPEENRKPYLVIVTGKGRRGSVAPADCRYGMDFSKKSMPNALVQGIAGRLTGYFKDVTWVILSDYNAALLNRYIETGRWQEKKRGGRYEEIAPSPHISSGSEHSAAVPGSDIEDNLRLEIQKAIKELAEVRTDKDGKLHISRQKVGCVFPWKLLEPLVSLIENDKEISGNKAVLLPSQEETRVTGKEFMEIKSGMVQVAIRLAGLPAETNSNLITDRDSMGRQRVVPVLVVDKNMRLITIKLRLAETLVKNDLTKRSMYSTWENPSAKEHDQIVMGAGL